jgi:RHS repeat-associated protein
MRALVAAVLLFGASGGAFAQTLACNPKAPRTDPGAGFVAFGTTEQALARGGNSGPAWEWAIGTDTDGSAKTQGSADWTSGKSYDWTLTYSGTGSASLVVRDGLTTVLSLSYPSDMDAGNALQLEVALNSSIGSDTSIAASVTSISGKAASGGLSLTGSNTGASQALYFYYPPMSQGFAAQGNVTLTYASLPTGSRVDFTLKAGTLPCANQPPTIALTSPTAGAILRGGTAATLSVNAADADGTVTQVEYFANATSLGAAATAPYSIQWTPQPGSYTLTAVATDNAGDTTSSDPVTVTVTPGVAKLYFIEVDHLDTPRLVADATGTTVWKWDQQEPFGDNVPDQNPSGTAVFDLPLRLPGQYFDEETNLHYNYFRDYDPSLGRYGESDPIGIRVGMNTFAYTAPEPLAQYDKTGLCITFKFPIDFSYSSIGYWGAPGKWTMQAVGTQGGEPESLIPVWTVECYCWRETRGTRERTIKIKWREISTCNGCGGKSGSRDYWGDPSVTRSPISKFDHKTFAFFTINEQFAEHECEEKCDSLNH